MKDKIIKMLRDGPLSAASDNLARAKFAFREFPAEQMKLEHCQSGSTRQSIVDGYQQKYDEIVECILWLEQTP